MQLHRFARPFAHALPSALRTYWDGPQLTLHTSDACTLLSGAVLPRSLGRTWRNVRDLALLGPFPRSFFARQDFSELLPQLQRVHVVEAAHWAPQHWTFPASVQWLFPLEMPASFWRSATVLAALEGGAHVTKGSFLEHDFLRTVTVEKQRMQQVRVGSGWMSAALYEECLQCLLWEHAPDAHARTRNMRACEK